MPEDKISRSMIDTIKESDLAAVASELTEVVVDNLTQAGLLRDIAVINTLVAIG